MRRKNNPVKIGVIGCGNVATKRHLPILTALKTAEITALADINEKTLNRAGEKYSIKDRYLDYRNLLQNRNVEAVGIFAPLQHHFEITAEALDAGKHILLEKPFTMDLQEADQLIIKANSNDKKIMIGLNKRWHPLVREARNEIRSGKLGTIKIVNAVFSCGYGKKNVPDWRMKRDLGGGSLLENGTHIFDLWYFLTGDEIEEVSALTGTAINREDDPSVVIAKTKNGIFLNCSLSDTLPTRGEIEIFGTDCGLRFSIHRFDGYELTPLFTNAGNIPNRVNNIMTFLKKLPYGLLNLTKGGDYRASFIYQWEHFIDCIQQDKPVECNLEDGRRALKVALAALISSSSKKTVKLNQITAGNEMQSS